MLEIIYKVIEINGDYALCESERGEQTNIAIALLPCDIMDGDYVKFSNFTYEKL